MTSDVTHQGSWRIKLHPAKGVNVVGAILKRTCRHLDWSLITFPENLKRLFSIECPVICGSLEFIVDESVEAFTVIYVNDSTLCGIEMHERLG